MKKSVLFVGSERLNNPLTSMPGEEVRFQVASVSKITERPSIQNHLQSDGRELQMEALIFHQRPTLSTLLSFLELLNRVEIRLLVFGKSPFDIIPGMDMRTYPSSTPETVIQIHAAGEPSGNLYFIRDKGVGLDKRYVHSLSGVFQKRRSREAFRRIEISVALIKKLIYKHYGEVWPEPSPGKGASFHFCLPKTNSNEYS